MNNLQAEKTGRLFCWLLVVVDTILATVAVLFPEVYCAILHPKLDIEDIPVDLIVRTGLLWAAFMGIQLLAALSRDPHKWFFCVGLLRLLEVPADLAYAYLARGATPQTQLLILAAPAFNFVVGIMLVRFSSVIRMRALQPGPLET